jgi:copper chaperone
MNELILEVPGMSCAHCEAAIMSEVGKVAGVGGVGVDLTSKLVTVTGEQLDVQVITAAIDEAGFEVAGYRKVR